MIPALDRLLGPDALGELVAGYGRPPVTEAACSFSVNSVIWQSKRGKRIDRCI
ncbi:MAG: hypothetical protein IH606_22185 [Burkholderiales bacterium]|nr:hypothetical protein [Burkholderiales bacterium]